MSGSRRPFDKTGWHLIVRKLLSQDENTRHSHTTGILALLCVTLCILAVPPSCHPYGFPGNDRMTHAPRQYP